MSTRKRSDSKVRTSAFHLNRFLLGLYMAVHFWDKTHNCRLHKAMGRGKSYHGDLVCRLFPDTPPPPLHQVSVYKTLDINHNTTLLYIIYVTCTNYTVTLTSTLESPSRVTNQKGFYKSMFGSADRKEFTSPSEANGNNVILYRKLSKMRFH